jgi:hypothetical protein
MSDQALKTGSYLWRAERLNSDKPIACQTAGSCENEMPPRLLAFPATRALRYLVGGGTRAAATSGAVAFLDR